MNNTVPYKTLLVCVAVTFALTIGSYAHYSANPISARLGFATFVSVVPGVLTCAEFKWAGLPRSHWNAVTVYVVALVVTLVLRGWVRGW